MFNATRGAIRLCRIVYALLTYGVLPGTGLLARRLRDPSYGRRVYLCLKSLGPTFIKFGQSLSARVDVVGEDVAENLLLMCDQLPPFPYSDVVAIIEGQFHKKMGDIFLEFAEEPIAAASIAQVHKARTLDGKLKAVKVLRPGVEAQFASDINLMKKIAEISRALGIFTRFKLPELVETFSNICKLELDLRFEAANADELRKNLLDDAANFYIPSVDWKHTSRRVLTLEWIDAVPIHKVGTLCNREELAKKLIVSFCNQVYRDRFFHADMHPGNLMVDANGRIVAVDFGIMGRLNGETCFFITEIFLGFLNRDYKRVAEAHYEAGYVPSRHDDFITACRAIWEPIADVDAQSFSIAELLAQLFKITADFNMSVQPQLLLLQKTMVLVEGMCRQLAPDMNFWKVAELWVKEHYQRDGYVERLRKSKAFRSAVRVRSFVSKVNRCMDAVISYEEKLQSQRRGSNARYVVFLIIITMLLGIVIYLK
ncbi:2-polyprenylphenol 6-hydroxylase [Candidatus Anaplasma sp. TIGMIC]|uniref:2-polyprenylphenol 6-hydroxylase n=1 Tax=Candidatus Anaplasma sp. TIGMIC TaxID=3020713 RepID=UPI00232FCF1B|nr:2-polyprenylphenol 6-hydroxylase [Candidatus Anaplasma sp. TIGMIC]MDB1135104.1 2-polyprenylphenol 6-hydroxylase [Candidatus Anaplasma sp. TIGMIC]